MAVLPPYVLDQLFASLDPLRSRLTEVWVQAQMAWAPESTKSGWFGSLRQASDTLTDASIEGRRGQMLAMGELTVQQWYAGPDSAADLIEFVAGEVGLSAYSIRRLWREVVIPTAVEIGEKVPKVGGAIIEWGPIIVAGAGALWLWWNFAPRRALAGWRGVRRRRLKR